MIPVFIPLRDGHNVTEDTWLSVMRQSIQLSVIPISRPGQASKRAGEAVCRNALLRVMSQQESGAAVMMDRDAVLPHRECVELAIMQLASGGMSLGAVHIWCKSGTRTGHMDMHCVVMCVAAAVGLSLDLATKDEDCLCNMFGYQLKKHGFTQEWLRTQQNERE